MARFQTSLAVVAACFLGFTACSGKKFLSQQSDPGKAGNGVEQQNGPYQPPAEVTRRLNNALYGKLSEPALFVSKTFGLTFKYRVYVPAQYLKGQPAALMVFQDASSVYLGLMNTPLVLDNLIHTGEIPVTIALFLDPGTATGEYVHDRDKEARSAQYDAIDDKYGKFLTEEIIPKVVRSRYKIVNDPNGWAIAGQSSGGAAAFTVAWQRPDFFRKVLTQNGSFVNIRGAGGYPELVRTEPVKPLRVYLLSSTNDLSNEAGNWFAANQAMARAFGERNYDYRFRSGTGEHFPPIQAQADFADALRWLWRGYSIESRASMIRRAMGDTARR
jgi:enterochelin esterase-like enzyme